MKKKKADLIKSEGEGDWGTGIIDDQPREIMTDWPREFRPLDPHIRPNESDKVEVTRTISTEDQPRPGPSSRPTSVRDLPSNVRHGQQSDPLLTRGERDKPVNNRQSAPLLTKGEGDRSTPLNRQSAPLFTRGEEDRSTSLNTREEKNRQASTQRSSFLTQGYKTQSRRQQESVSGQKLEGQHIWSEQTPRPTLRQRTDGRTKWPHISTARTSTRQTQTRTTSPPKRTRFRRRQTSIQDHQVSPMDEVPAWAPSWRRERMERQGERGREQGPSTCNGDRGGARLRHGIGP